MLTLYIMKSQMTTKSTIAWLARIGSMCWGIPCQKCTRKSCTSWKLVLTTLSRIRWQCARYISKKVSTWTRGERKEEEMESWCKNRNPSYDFYFKLSYFFYSTKVHRCLLFGARKCNHHSYSDIATQGYRLLICFKDVNLELKIRHFNAKVFPEAPNFSKLLMGRFVYWFMNLSFQSV